MKLDEKELIDLVIARDKMVEAAKVLEDLMDVLPSSLHTRLDVLLYNISAFSMFVDQFEVQNDVHHS